MFPFVSVMMSPLLPTSGLMFPNDETMRMTVLVASVGLRYLSGMTTVMISFGRAAFASAIPL